MNLQLLVASLEEGDHEVVTSKQWADDGSLPVERPGPCVTRHLAAPMDPGLELCARVARRLRPGRGPRLEVVG